MLEQQTKKPITIHCPCCLQLLNDIYEPDNNQVNVSCDLCNAKINFVLSPGIMDLS
jgi:hypothetical protein